METLVEVGPVAVRRAAALLRRDGLVAFPTETVYGLGADARRDDAVRKIYAAKGRPPTNPLIVHVADVAAARACAAAGGWNDLAEKLAEKFWPGPLTVVVRRGAGLSALVSAGRETVALRCPRHPVALELLRAFGGPIAAPSANRSGFVSPTTAAHVLAELDGRVELIVDGGPCEVGLESTVIDVSGVGEDRTGAPHGNAVVVGGTRDSGAAFTQEPEFTPMILRPGAITREMIESVIGPVRVFQGHVSLETGAASPGLLERHYAPRTPARRFSREQWPAVQAWIARQSGRIALLSHDPAISLPAPHETVCLPPDDAGYARLLYDALRQADEQNVAAIVILVPMKDDGLWLAVHDRLRRATRPFDEHSDVT